MDFSLKKETGSVDRKILSLYIFGIISAILLIVLVNFSINIVSGLRAAISGEAIWAKAQKEAVIHLNNYIYSENNADYEAFQSVLRITDGLEQARLQVYNEDFNYNAAYEGLKNGMIPQEDIPEVLFIIENFSLIPGLDDALTAWEQADQKIAELKDFASDISSEIQRREITMSQKEEWADQLSQIDHNLTELEYGFSIIMAGISRQTGTKLRWVSMLLGLSILGAGGFLAIWYLKGTHKWALSMEESEKKFRTVLENSQDLIYRVRLRDGQYDFMSPSVEKLFGYPVEKFMEEGSEFVVSLTHPEDLERIREEVKKYNRNTEEGFLRRLEFRVKNASGEYRWFSNTRTLVKDEKGKAVAIVGNGRDVTEKKQQDKKLKESLKEKEILLQEIHHRVKNNLAIISSLLELQKSGVDESVEKLLNDSQNRIRSIAKVHEKLYESANLSEINLSAYVKELIEELSMAYGSEEKSIDLQMDVDPIEMDINQTIYCGLVLNELINNAYKHAFNDTESGIIKISAKQVPEGVNIKVSNNGSELPDDYDPMAGDSLGMTLVHVLSEKYKGTLDYETGEWTTFSVLFHQDES